MSTGTILLVAGDQLPNVQIALTNQLTGAPTDLSAAGNNGVAATVAVKMRQAGTTTVLAELPGNFVNDGSDGLVAFMFVGTALQVGAGIYEFEVDINFNGLTQTVYDLLRARVRARF
jgi:hypothetical protein